MTEPKHTVLHAEHEALGASFTDFGGWDMPLKYQSELAEHRAVRNHAGLFDLSHMGEVWVRGRDAAEALDYALVGNLGRVSVGRAKYSMMCTPDGGIIDDLISYRRDHDAYLVVPNAANTDRVYAELVDRAAGFDAVVENVTAQTSLIALQGPAAEQILLTEVPDAQADSVRELKYYAACDATVAGVSVMVARTGYTGEDGFELYVPNEHATELWQALLAAHESVAACGLASRDSLRLEAAMPLYGHELSEQVTPFEAGLGPVVSLPPLKTAKDSDFVGRRALAAVKTERAENPEAGTTLVGLRGDGRRAARAGYAVLDADQNVIGHITSGQPSPTLGYPVALAFVDVGHSAPGTALAVDLRGKAEPFTVVETPFYTRSAPRSKDAK